MPPSQPADKAPERDAPRHPYGPRPLAALMPSLLAPAFARHPPATAQAIADWSLIAGPRLAAVTRPQRLAGGTLTVACTGPVAMELQHGSDMLIARVNQHLGRAVVQRLRLVQEATPIPTLAAPLRPIRDEDRSALERSLAELAPGPIREALAALGIAVRRAGSTDDERIS